MSEITIIESGVPFGHALYVWLHLNDLRLNNVIHHDQMEKTYLAWETVRKECNPYFETGTGFEGYFVGRCDEPEAALTEILAINQHILDAIARMYRFEYGFQTRLFRTLTRDYPDEEAIHIWSAYFGAELARLRVHVLQEPKAQEFQRQTYKIISMLPPISYHETDHNVAQAYSVGSLPAPHYDKIVVNNGTLKPDQQDAWLLAQNIGVFGHPLIRRFLDRVSPLGF